MIVLPYEKARYHIEEADVLLFRHGNFPSIGWWVAKYGHSYYSHAALAHWDSERLYCVEQREFKGGRSVSLSSQVKQHPQEIDVFRARPVIHHPDFKSGAIEWKKKVFNNEVGREITGIALGLTGSPYGWSVIWNILKSHLPIARLAERSFERKDKEKPNFCVCSTLVAYAYRVCYCDPNPFLQDTKVQPADLARSALFEHVISIREPEEET